MFTSTGPRSGALARKVFLLHTDLNLVSRKISELRSFTQKQPGTGEGGHGLREKMTCGRPGSSAHELGDLGPA